MLTSEGHSVDGSWLLRVTVMDLTPQVELRVKGDMRVGTVMLNIFQKIDVTRDWSDYALYWTSKRLWLGRTRCTLDQYGVQGGDTLVFRPMHGPLVVRLPDFHEIVMRVDFSANVFNNVVKLCKQLAIRHPEELSLSRIVEKKNLKKDLGVILQDEKKTKLASPDPKDISRDISRGLQTPGTPETTLDSGYNPFAIKANPHHKFNANSGFMTPSSCLSLDLAAPEDPLDQHDLLISPRMEYAQLKEVILFASTAEEKARLSCGWLDSSKGLLEQGIEYMDKLQLKFKFLNNFDLNKKHDAVRINQLYEDMRIKYISGEIKTDSETGLLLTYLQVAILKKSLGRHPLDEYDDLDLNQSQGAVGDALDQLQNDLDDQESNSNSKNILKVPELDDDLEVSRSNKSFRKSYRLQRCTFKGAVLELFSTNSNNTNAQMTVNLKGGKSVSTTFRINSEKDLFHVILNLACLEELLILQFKKMDQFVKWAAAFKTILFGCSLVDPFYQNEMDQLYSLLMLRRKILKQERLDEDDDDLETDSIFEIGKLDLRTVAPLSMIKDVGKKKIYEFIDKTLKRNKSESLNNMKLNFIRIWKGVDENCRHFFAIRLKNSKKKNMLTLSPTHLELYRMVGSDKLERLDGWPLNRVESWRVNWQTQLFNVGFGKMVQRQSSIFTEEEETCQDKGERTQLDFHVLTTHSKTFHEFIGGYIFLSMRSGSKAKTLDETLFQKLTGGIEN